MVFEEKMKERVVEIKLILENEKDKCNDNEINKLEFEKEILERYLVEE